MGRMIRFLSILGLFSGAVFAQNISTPVFVLKDGDATAAGYSGTDKSIYVDGGVQQSVGWITFQTQGIDVSKIASAKLVLFVNALTSPGTLQMRLLSADITAPENNVRLTSIAADVAVATSLPLGTSNIEQTLQIDLTIAVKSGTFKGVALMSSDGLAVSFDSKEGHLAPMILLTNNVDNVGAKWLSGTAIPSSSSGKDGDYYLNTTNGDVSAKALGAWTVVTNIVGPAGLQGAKGDKGDQGIQGLTGASGATGAIGPRGPAGTSGADPADNAMDRLELLTNAHDFISRFPRAALQRAYRDGTGPFAAHLLLNGKSTGQVMGFIGNDGISKIYDYMVVIRYSGALVPQEYIDANAVLALSRGPVQVYFAGIVTTLVATPAGQEDMYYVITIKPELSKLERASGFHAWHDFNCSDIIASACENAGISTGKYEFNILGTLIRFPFQFMYNETPFAFVGRLAATEGVHFHFEHGEASEKSVFADNNSQFQSLATTITLVGNPPWKEQWQLYSFGRGQSCQAACAGVMGYDYEKPNLDFRAIACTGGGGPKFWSFQDGITEKEDATALSRVQMRRQTSGASECYGTGNAWILKSGIVFPLEDNTVAGLAGAYLITDARHLCVWDADSGRLYYCNTFSAILSSIEYVPPLTTPALTIQGVVSAKVIAEATPNFLGLGRVKVRLRFPDLYSVDSSIETPLIRVLMPSWTAYIPQLRPRIGKEVLISFIQGNPSNPVVLGTVFNGDDMLPDPAQAPIAIDDQGMRLNHTAGISLNTAKDLSVNAGNYSMIANRVDAKVKGRLTLSVADSAHLTLGQTSLQTGELNMKTGSTTITSEGLSMNANYLDALVNSRLTISVGDSANLALGQITSLQTGELNMKSDGDMNLLATGSATITSEGLSMNANHLDALVNSRLTISVGDSAHLALGQKTSLQTGELNMKSDGDMNLSAAGSTAIAGAHKTVIASKGTLGITAGSTLQITGDIISLNKGDKPAARVGDETTIVESTGKPVIINTGSKTVLIGD